jgi:hypothetical protein
MFLRVLKRERFFHAGALYQSTLVGEES